MQHKNHWGLTKEHWSNEGGFWTETSPPQKVKSVENLMLVFFGVFSFHSGIVKNLKLGPRFPTPGCTNSLTLIVQRLWSHKTSHKRAPFKASAQKVIFNFTFMTLILLSYPFTYVDNANQETWYKFDSSKSSEITSYDFGNRRGKKHQFCVVFPQHVFATDCRFIFIL